MKTRLFKPYLAFLIYPLVLASAALPASAETIYWNGDSPALGSWDLLTNWSTDPTDTTLNPDAKPGAADDVIFNITTVNADQTLTLNNNNQAANSLTFNSTGTTTIVRSTGATSTIFRTITLGAGGLTVNSGAGNVTTGIGAGEGSQFVNIGLIGNNFFKNDSSSALTIGRQVTAANDLGAITLTVNGSGSGLTDFQREIFQGATSAASATSNTTLSVQISTAADHTTLFRNAGSTYSGGLVINSGFVGSRTSNGFGAGTVTINGGAIGATFTNRSFGNNLVIGGNVQFGGITNAAGGGSSAATWNGNVDLGGETRIITLGGNSQTFAGEISNGGLTVSASGGTRTLILNGTSIYTGGTTINPDVTLTINGDNSAATGQINVAAGASIGGNGISGGAVVMAPAATLNPRITDWTGVAGTGYDDLTVASLNAGGAALNLVVTATGLINFTETNQSFTILNASGGITGFDTVQVSVTTTNFPGTGTWALAQSGSSLVLNYTAAITDPFQAWIGGFTVADATMGGDSDNDGITNLMEFVLNGNPEISDTDILPDLALNTTDFTFSYVRREDSTGVPQVVQYGSDLSGWADVAIPAAAGTTNVGAATVTVGAPAGGTQTVTVTIPTSASVGGKLFARLMVGP